jgi:hypothetical protein
MTLCQLSRSDMLTMRWIICFRLRFSAAQDCEACPIAVFFLDPLATHSHIAGGVSTGIKYSVHPDISAVQFQVRRASILACYIKSRLQMYSD